MTAGGAAAFAIPILLPLPVQKAEAEAMLPRGCGPCLFADLDKVATNLLAGQLNLLPVWRITRGVHDIEGVPTALVHSEGLDLGTRDGQVCLLEDASQCCQASKPVH